MANTFIFNDDQPESGGEISSPESSPPGAPEGGQNNNRTFLIVAIILGGIVLLSLVCMAVYAFMIMPGQKSRAQATSQANAAANTQVAFMQMETQEAALFTATPPPAVEPSAMPTETLVVVFASATPMPVPTEDPATATVEALQTKLAFVSQATVTAQKGTPGTPGTPVTQTLAETGFADEVGLPGLLFASIFVIAIIILTRRLRQAS